MRYIVAGLALMFSVALVLSTGTVDAQGKDEPKYTIKEVMKKAHVGGLLKKVTGGKASAEEKEQLVELYVALCQNKAPKGEQAEWVARCKEIVAAAKGAAKGEEKAVAALGKATNCGACHKLHK